MKSQFPGRGLPRYKALYAIEDALYRTDKHVADNIDHMYVFWDKLGTMLKYIEWDGQGFQQGKRRAQSGTYPWPKGQVGEVVEISEKELDYLLEKKENEIAALNRQVEWLTQQLRLMQGQRFGASSEQTQVLSEQLCLFNEAAALADSKTAEPDLEQITYKRRKQTGKRELDLFSLPTEQVIHELRSAERVYPECGGPLHQCGQTAARRELVYVPAKYKVVEHVQTAYSCRRRSPRRAAGRICGGNSRTR